MLWVALDGGSHRQICHDLFRSTIDLTGHKGEMTAEVHPKQLSYGKKWLQDVAGNHNGQKTSIFDTKSNATKM